VALERLPKTESGDLYNLACCYALLHGLAQEKGSGLTTADADTAVEKAMGMLHRAKAAGYRDVAHMHKDTELDSLRKLPEFEMLLADLEKDIRANGK
jgi:hypothetical protein